MNSIVKANTQVNEWITLKQFTSARIALGKTGTAIPLKECLNLKLAHAHAKDAVYSVLDTHYLLQQLHNLQVPALTVHSNADNRDIYLQRPDLGRRLDVASAEMLSNLSLQPTDVVIVIADGLSALAKNKYAIELTSSLLQELKKAGYTIAPVIIAEQSRVALADEIGQLLKARLSVILIGERPGLSAFDSMGAYITYAPAIGNTDESRNCISNIRTGGLTPAQASTKIMQLISAAFTLQLTGVALKDNNINYPPQIER
jgi:ethanolamine ammonia-lyase small subunit